MTFEEWASQYVFLLDDIQGICQRAFEAGAASRDDEIAELRQQLAAQDKQVTLLRDEVIRCRDWFEAQAEVTSKGGPSSWELMLLRDERDTANEALAITRPKP